MDILALFFRINQFVWIILVTSLIGNILAQQYQNNSAVNYAMFTAAFAWVVWFYGMAAVFVDKIAVPLILIILDSLAMIFTLIAAIVIPAKLDGVHDCNNPLYTNYNSIIIGGNNRPKRCRELQASTAFLWFLFASFLGSLILSAIQGSRNGAFNSSSMSYGRQEPSRSRSESRPDGPTMSQV